MAYSSDIADVLTAQLNRLAKLNPHQLAGQTANLEFWLSEVRHCLAVIDGYRARFERLKDAQTQFARERGSEVFDLRYDDSIPETPLKPRRVPDEELQSSRRELREAFYRFLIRAYRERLV